MEKEDEFKKEVIDLVYFGKYAQALKLLEAKVIQLITQEYKKEQEAIQNDKRLY